MTVGLGSPYYSFTGLSSAESFVTLGVGQDGQEESSFDGLIDPVYQTVGDTKYIAVIIDYYSDAIEYIYSSFLGDPILESYDSILHFICDWTMEVL